MQPFEIHYARFQWKDSEDERPWLVIDYRSNSYGAFPLSSHCYNGVDCFWIDPDHPDFASTNLRKGGYVHYTSIFDLPASCFRRCVGKMTGNMLADFCREAGGISPLVQQCDYLRIEQTDFEAPPLFFLMSIGYT